ncbi:MAG: nitroreductase family protein [Muribaculaceae bacterium]|nr:nitroreductase family protein [Muribaculaceae bacterium]
MNIIEAMKERRSVRTFDGKGISADQKAALEHSIAGAGSPFGGSVTIRLKQFDLKSGYRPGTYGMIRGAELFFLLAFGPDEASALSAGFRFEQVVLEAWHAGLGTCWIAGTFKGSDFQHGESWPTGEELKVVCPVGIAAAPTLTEKIARFAVGSKNRKPFDSLFFSGDFSTPVSPDDTFHEALEMMRLAPSSTNSQPWRALVTGSTVHFYYAPKSSISVLDTGIGIRHFYDTEQFHSHAGIFARLTSAPTPPDNWKYLTSYTRR